MRICRNIRCNKVIDFEEDKIKLEGLCMECQIKSLNSEKYSNVYCEGCGEIFIIRPKLIGDKANEVSICPKCKVEISKREKETW